MSIRHRVASLAVLLACLVPSATASADAQLDAATAASLSSTMPRSALAGESIYMVMTDRYANGDTANDRGSRTMVTGLALGGFDPVHTGWFHGGDLKGLTENLDRVKRLGFTAVWITPPFVNRAVQGSSAGYHGYWILDFTDIDPHLGTKADFAAFVAKAHGLGLKVYVDIVMNHTADVIQYTDLIGGFGAPGTKHPFIPDGLEQVRAPAFLNDIDNYHNQGSIQDWSDPNQYVNGDFNALDDIKTENQAVVDGFAEVFANWLVDYGIDGFRIDTAKHVDDAYFQRWIPELMARVLSKSAALGRPAVQPQMFGEVYTPQATVLATYLRDRGLPSVLDFDAQQVVDLFAAGTAPARSLALLLAADDAYNAGARADGFVRNAYGLPVFGGNHDMGRTAMIVSNRGGWAHPLQRTELAYAVLFLMRGAPVTYYGDEVGMVGSDGDQLAREDMFPTQVGAWQQEERIGSPPIGTGSSLTRAAEQLPMARYLRALNHLRATYPALREGALILRLAQGQTAAWSRVDGADRREFVVAVNTSDRPTSVTLPTSSPSTRFASLLGGKLSATTSTQGRLRIAVPARAVLVLRAARQLPLTTAAPELSTTLGYDRDLRTYALRASGSVGSDPTSVTFVARRCPTCEWSVLGVDDAAPYRLPIDARAWGDAQGIEVAAIARTSDGRVAAGPVATFARSAVVGQ